MPETISDMHSLGDYKKERRAGKGGESWREPGWSRVDSKQLHSQSEPNLKALGRKTGVELEKLLDGSDFV